MTVKANRDQHGRTYLILRCDGCNTAFTCYDDACYRRDELNIAATFAGWEVRQSPEHTHRCPSCASTPDPIRP